MKRAPSCDGAVHTSLSRPSGRIARSIQGQTTKACVLIAANIVTVRDAKCFRWEDRHAAAHAERKNAAQAASNMAQHHDAIVCLSHKYTIDVAGGQKRRCTRVEF